MERSEVTTHDYRFKGTPGMGVLALGVAALVGAGAMVAMGQVGGLYAKYAYLVGFMYCLSIALGGLFFSMLHHLANARWSVVVRRISESIMMNLPWMFLASLPILFWMKDIFPWMQAAVQEDPAVKVKLPYLNQHFFIIRTCIYFAIWTILGSLFYFKSLKQDRTGDVGISVMLRKVAAPGMILFALSLTFCAFDYMMSLNPKWYSTIFGVYYFAGSYWGFMALLILMATHLRVKGIIPVISEEHFHDMGKYLFAWTVFWTYIAFSQFLLIWMGNLPEETIFYSQRWNAAGWQAMTWFLLGGHFIFPFLFLLPRTIKRHKLGLAVGALWALLMHFIDIYWLIMPNIDHAHFSLMPFAFAILLSLGMLCVFTFLVYTRMRGKPLIPVRDPYLADSIAFENP